MSEALSARIDDRWILAQRPAKNPVAYSRPYAYSVEKERTAEGQVEEVATIFLTNRECPFRCLMCDLWKNTTDQRTPAGAISSQIHWALNQLSPAAHLKLYNSGNFFDANAIPPEDLPRIAKLLAGFKSVIVECHPRLVDERCLAFQNLLQPKLQVAMGLETAHPEVLERLNKRMTLEDFARAARYLMHNGMLVRAFILLRPPFLNEVEGVIWAKRSLDFAFDVGVECCVIIPTRGGNGALERLHALGLFSPPQIESLEEVLEYGLQLKRGRVFVDLWDIDKFSRCNECCAERVQRLRRMNLAQAIAPPIHCRCRELS
jgi:radical SAM enzyme (TIGR01210 family)